MIASLVLFAALAHQATAPGATVMLWQLEQPFEGIPKLVESQAPNKYFVHPELKLNGPFDAGTEPISQNLYGEVKTTLRVATAATYDFEVRTNTKLRMTLSGETMVNTTDPVFEVVPGVYRGQYRLPAGRAGLALYFMHNDGDLRLDVRWKASTETEFRAIDPTLLTTEAGQTFVVSPGPKRASLGAPTTRPGDRRPLDRVHPSFSLEEFRGEDFRPAVGGMCFLPDGRLAVCTWDERGAVYFLDLKSTPARAELFADGIGEPLGIAYWNGDIYVTQKGEVTRLRDTDEDGRADEFKTVAYGWGVSPNYHEFTFNLVPFQGKFYISSSVPLRGGHTNYTPQDDAAHPAYSTPEGPGRIYRIDPLTGAYEAIANGLRTPNGMNVGVDGRLFVADNQGTWLPASTLYCIEEGATYLHREQPGGESPTDNVTVWFPHGEIGNSPSQMVLIPDGVYRGQMLIGDVTYGGLQRVQLEKVNGHYQGAVYRHSQGLEAGVNRLVWGPDNCLYVGMIGSNGNWNHLGHKFGLERLRPTGEVPFEVLELSVRRDGFQVTFTQPVSADALETLKKAVVKSFAYVPMMDYGGPKRDEKSLTVAEATVSNGGRTAYLAIDGLDEKRVIHFHFGDLKSATGELLWSPEAFYSLQRLPGELPVVPMRSPERFAKPADAIVLIGEGGSGELVPSNPAAPRWQVVGDALEVVHEPSADIGGSDQISPFNHGDVRVHLEWLSPPGGELSVQTNGNSGIKLQSRYEIQIMNAPGILDLAAPEAKFNEAGSIYRQSPPLWNPSYGAGVWQTYDIWFTAARWEGDKKTANARITLYWNGVLVHDDAEILDKTGLSVPEGPEPLPLLLQDHHTEADGGVRFRNTWLVHDPIAKGMLPPRGTR